jgi:hypothetical protein
MTKCIMKLVKMTVIIMTFNKNDINHESSQHCSYRNTIVNGLVEKMTFIIMTFTTMTIGITPFRIITLITIIHSVMATSTEPLIQPRIKWLHDIYKMPYFRMTICRMTFSKMILSNRP